MEINHHHIPVPGALLTIALTAVSILLNFFGFITEIDNILLMPILHVLQIIASAVAVIVGFATIHPGFKQAIIDIVDSFKRAKK